MAVRATRFGGPVAVSTGNTTIFTVPTGMRYLVRTFVLVNVSSTLAGVINTGVDATTAGARLDSRSVPALETVQLMPWWVLNEGESLIAIRTSGTGGVTVSAHGYALEL